MGLGSSRVNLGRGTDQYPIGTFELLVLVIGSRFIRLALGVRLYLLISVILRVENWC